MSEERNVLTDFDKWFQTSESPPLAQLNLTVDEAMAYMEQVADMVVLVIDTEILKKLGKRGVINKMSARRISGLDSDKQEDSQIVVVVETKTIKA